MTWFLVLLFWNAHTQQYLPLAGWEPLPHMTSERCERSLEYVNRYLLDDATNVSDCIEAVDAETAINILKR